MLQSIEHVLLVGLISIQKWIWTTLAREAELSKELTFDKVEATAEDVIVILRYPMGTRW
jgi:hypothetical protein